ncbi:MAG TPA: DUF4157 domain-containing protein, partial [Acidimicrobiales bacterium]|nr:DUF4157 domain-containing protein [Acidimicrobiales bacterium]
MAPEMREHFSAAYGSDIGDVRVHPSTSLASDLGARAFTVGNHVAFAPGQFTPGTAGGERLIAHEMAHVVQQAGGSGGLQAQGLGHDAYEAEADAAAAASMAGKAVELSPVAGSACPCAQLDPQETPDYSAETKEEFEQRVFEKATARLLQNEEHLAQWRDFISTQLDETETAAQVRAGEALELYGEASARGRTEAFERWCGLRRPHQRMVEEAVMRGQIRGACQYCHETNVAWGRDVRLLDQLRLSDFRSIPTPEEELSHLASYVAARRAGWQGGPLVDVTRSSSADEMRLATRQLEGWLQSVPPPQKTEAAGARPAVAPATGPTTTPAAAPGAPPPPLELPGPRSDLCGDLPSAEDTPSPPTFDPAEMGPCTRIALAAVARIRPMLEPLGPAGYRILPRGVFSRLYDASPAELKAMVLESIDRRRDQYQELRGLIDAGAVPYLEFCPVVDELLPTTNEQVRDEVIFEQTMETVLRGILDVLLFVGAAILLLAFLIPPIGLAIGAGALLALSGLVSVGQLATGLHDIQRGRTLELGIGAGVYSPEQEAMAHNLQAMGTMSAIMGALGIVATGVSAFRWVTAAPRVVPPAGWTGRSTPAGMMFTNPAHPELVFWVEGATIEATNAAGEVIGYGVISGGRAWFVAGARPAAFLEASTGLPGPAGGPLLPGGPPGLPQPAVTPLLPGGPRGLLPAPVPPAEPPVNVLPLRSPAAGQAPAYLMPVGPQGQGGVILMGR